MLAIPQTLCTIHNVFHASSMARRMNSVIKNETTKHALNEISCKTNRDVHSSVAFARKSTTGSSDCVLNV